MLNELSFAISLSEHVSVSSDWFGLILLLEIGGFFIVNENSFTIPCPSHVISFAWFYYLDLMTYLL